MAGGAGQGNGDASATDLNRSAIHTMFVGENDCQVFIRKVFILAEHARAGDRIHSGRTPGKSSRPNRLFPCGGTSDNGRTNTLDAQA